ncbi:MAG: TolC family protein, partial [Terriglobales bacterium]
MSPYVAHQVAPPSFGNTPRIETLLKDGKLRLSLSDAVVLALENNLDLAIARFNLSIADTDILRAKSGESVRGVATGLVQGTP